MRERPGRKWAWSDAGETMLEPDPAGRIPPSSDRPESVAWFKKRSRAQNEIADVSASTKPGRARGGDSIFIVVSLGFRAFDGLRLCSHLRSIAETRNSPILVLVSEGESRKLIQALDMGVKDYLMRPVDRNEARGPGTLPNCARSATAIGCTITCS